MLPYCTLYDFLTLFRLVIPLFFSIQAAIRLRALAISCCAIAICNIASAFFMSASALLCSAFALVSSIRAIIARDPSSGFSESHPKI